MKEYIIHIDGEFDFVIIFPHVIGSLISKIRTYEKRVIVVSIGEIMPERMIEYLLNVINTNRFAHSQFRFQQILEDPVSKESLYQVLKGQLENMDIDDTKCFDKVELFEMLTGDSGLAVACTIPFFWACKDTLASFIYTYVDGRKEKIIIEC